MKVEILCGEDCLQARSIQVCFSRSFITTRRGRFCEGEGSLITIYVRYQLVCELIREAFVKVCCLRELLPCELGIRCGLSKEKLLFFNRNSPLKTTVRKILRVLRNWLVLFILFTEYLQRLEGIILGGAGNNTQTQNGHLSTQLVMQPSKRYNIVQDAHHFLWQQISLS